MLFRDTGLNDAATDIRLKPMRTSDWTLSRFFHHGDDFFRELVRRIREARTSIRVETYIYTDDALTRMLLEELGQARRRGCRVQLLVDGFGSYYWLDVLRERCARLEIELRVWEPLPHNFAAFRRLLRGLSFRFFRLMKKLNRRDHRKIVLVDDATAFLGSMNWTQVHSENLMGKAAWRDSGVILEGESVQDLVRAFVLAWKRSRRPWFRRIFKRGLRDPHYDPRASRVRLNQSRKDRHFFARDLIHRLDKARTRILIESAYFLPTRRVFMALVDAAKRGVQVEIIIPGPSDVPLVKWASANICRTLARNGVRIHEYQVRILHAKFLVIDDWAALGSTNFNHRSLFHDLEVEATFENPVAVKELARQWDVDRRLSRPYTESTYRAMPWFLRWLGALAFKMRWIL